MVSEVVGSEVGELVDQDVAKWSATAIGLNTVNVGLLEGLS